MKKFLKYIPPVITGLLLTLIQPLPWKINLGFLAWVAIAPFVAGLRDRTQLERFVLAVIMGAAHFDTALYWIVFTLNTYGNLNIVGSIFVGLLLVALETSYVIIFALLMGRVMDRMPGLPVTAALPIVWVFYEFLRAFTPFGGFPWVLLGYSQGGYPVMSMSADIGGVWLVTFIIAAFNGMIVDLYEWKPSEEKSFPWKPVVAACLIFIMNVGYGVYRVGEVEAHNDVAPAMKVAALQGDIRQDQKWDENYERMILSRYLTLHDQAVREGAELVVWPEAATPFALERTPMGRSLYLRLAAMGAYAILGSVDYIVEDEVRCFSNSAYLIGPDGIEGKYSKMHLVPFGEYIPYVKYLGFVDDIVKGAAGNFNAGKKLEVFKLPKGGVSVIICYEAIFGNEVRRFRKNGAELLVNITNDAWFGDTSAPRQHLSMAAFRCIENHTWMVRAANTGISAVVDPLGRIVAQTEVFTQDMLVQEVRMVPGTSFYARFGDLFLYIVLIVCLAGFANLIRLGGKQKKIEKDEG